MNVSCWFLGLALQETREIHTMSLIPETAGEEKKKKGARVCALPSLL